MCQIREAMSRYENQFTQAGAGSSESVSAVLLCSPNVCPANVRLAPVTNRCPGEGWGGEAFRIGLGPPVEKQGVGPEPKSIANIPGITVAHLRLGSVMGAWQIS
jgi:hypothetical protein